MTTRHHEQLEGIQISVEAGKLKEASTIGCPVGTTIEVQDLFFNTPARRKYLKTQAAETGQVSDLLSRMALARPDVKFELRLSGKTVFHSLGTTLLKMPLPASLAMKMSRACLRLITRANILPLEV
ncbi:hypothetical protein N752_24185 [Desulforamulus aquiferis]|nr:hypothetical protein [Desulforamulus aquiferis]RYD02433.1 hypothetical protein N752_24185 [Desulforamulus aquiferis]